MGLDFGRFIKMSDLKFHQTDDVMRSSRVILTTKEKQFN